jgi:hypothetical protein
MAMSGASALKRFPVKVVNMFRPVQADRDLDVASLETVQPLIVDQHAIGGHRDGDVTARSRRYALAGLRNAVKIIDSPQQGFAAVQNDGEIDQGMPGDVLFDALQQLKQHFRTHQLRLVVNRRVAEPVAIGTVDVASRSNFHE